jgi:hypothetical protein
VPTLSRRVLPWLAAAALLIPLAGCGGSSSDGSAAAAVAGDPAADSGNGRAGDCAMLIGPTVCFHYALTGSVTAQGTEAGQVATNNGVDYKTCADWTKGEPDGDDGEPSLSLPSGGPKKDGDHFGGLTGDIIEHYQGPGTYEKKDLSGLGSPSGIITYDTQDNFVLQEDSTGSATINADGSGSFTFADMGTGQSGNDATVSGSVTWTCHNPSD